MKRLATAAVLGVGSILFLTGCADQKSVDPGIDSAETFEVTVDHNKTIKCIYLYRADSIDYATGGLDCDWNSAK